MNLKESADYFWKLDKIIKEKRIKEINRQNSD